MTDAAINAGAGKKRCGATMMRKLLRDGAVVLAVVAAVLAWGVFRRPSQGAMLYYQYRAMHTDAAAGTPVYWTTPLLRSMTVDAMKNFGDDNDDPAGGAAPDGCTDILPAHLVPPGGAGDPWALDRLNHYMEYVLSDGMQVVFCHGVRGPDGVERLVVVTVGPERLRGVILPPLAWEAVVIDPAGWTDMPRVVGRRRGDCTDPMLAAAPARFFAGHVAAGDGAAFVMPYTCGGRTGTLTGRLLAGGRRVEMTDTWGGAK